MRRDMMKQITECYRRADWYQRQPRTRVSVNCPAVDDEGYVEELSVLPKRESIRAYKTRAGGFEFGENLSPIRRAIQRIFRHGLKKGWDAYQTRDEAWRQVCEVSTSGAMGSHVKDHARSFIEEALENHYNVKFAHYQRAMVRYVVPKTEKILLFIPDKGFMVVRRPSGEEMVANIRHVTIPGKYLGLHNGVYKYDKDVLLFGVPKQRFKFNDGRISEPDYGGVKVTHKRRVYYVDFTGTYRHMTKREKVDLAQWLTPKTED